MTIFFLSNKGFGSIESLEYMDIDRLLNLIEYVNIQNDIESHENEEMIKRGQLNGY